MKRHYYLGQEGQVQSQDYFAVMKNGAIWICPKSMYVPPDCLADVMETKKVIFHKTRRTGDTAKGSRCLLISGVSTNKRLQAGDDCSSYSRWMQANQVPGKGEKKLLSYQLSDGMQRQQSSGPTRMIRLTQRDNVGKNTG